jgi:ATP-dependent DNA helicase RecG
LEEGHFTDVKAKEIAPAKLTKTIVAFANAEGGEIYVGIKDGKAVRTRGTASREGSAGGAALSTLICRAAAW